MGEKRKNGNDVVGKDDCEKKNFPLSENTTESLASIASFLIYKPFYLVSLDAT